MEDREIYSFKKNAGETVRISLSEFKGHKLLDIRVYAKSRDTGKEVATKKGLTVNRGLAKELLEGLRRAIETIEGEA